MATVTVDPNGTPPDYGAMTLQQLRAETIRLTAALSVAQDQRKDIAGIIIEVRRAQAAAAAHVGQLNDLQKDALRDVLGPGP